MTYKEAKLFETVLIDYYGNEKFVIVGIREHELELRGDWSAMNNVIGNSWYDIKKCMSINHEFKNVE